MEGYNYFCTITKHLYQELEFVAFTIYALKSNGMDYSELEAKRLDLLHKIEVHLEKFDIAILNKENNL